MGNNKNQTPESTLNKNLIIKILIIGQIVTIGLVVLILFKYYIPKSNNSLQTTKEPLTARSPQEQTEDIASYKINGESKTLDSREYNQKLQEQLANSNDTIRQQLNTVPGRYQFAEEMVFNDILLDKAVKSDIQLTDSYKDALEKLEKDLKRQIYLKDKIFGEVKPKEEDLKAFYEKNKKTIFGKPASITFLLIKGTEDKIDKLAKTDLISLSLNRLIAKYKDQFQINQYTLYEQQKLEGFPAKVTEDVNKLEIDQHTISEGPDKLKYIFIAIDKSKEFAEEYDKVKEKVFRAYIIDDRNKKLSKLKDDFFKENNVDIKLPQKNEQKK